MRVAVIDDDSSVCNALRRLLVSANVSTDVFESGREFLAAPPRWRLDCIVLDLKMPGMGGLELLRILNESQTRVPVIVMSASDSATVRTECEQLGASAFLGKPFEEHALFSAIKAAIDGSGKPSAVAVAAIGTDGRNV
jgi:FixJ family two-component response regulator